MTSSTDAPIAWFRNTAPYINLHRGATFVIMIPGSMQQKGLLPGLLHDVALLSSLGVRLVLVHGSRPQADARLAEAGHASAFHEGRRITDGTTLPLLQQVVGAQRLEIEAMLSLGLPNSPMQGAKLRVASGNFVVAQPLGVVEGVDYQWTGRVRRVDTTAINSLLDSGSLVLLNCLGFSPTGEAFNLSLGDVAGSAAQALKAEKLIVLTAGEGLHNEAGELIRQCIADDSESLALASADESEILALAARACRGGVERCQIVSYEDRDALLTELFTTDGSGTLVTQRPFEGSRWATINDVGGILELIAPLEASGVLLKRSRELLEAEIGRFRILERDGRITACAALYPFAEQSEGELACIVSHPAYQGDGRAQRLLRELEEEARKQGLNHVFVLTTQTAHWFREQGFVEASRDSLPPARQALYNLQRNSKVFRKTLTQRS